MSMTMVHPGINCYCHFCSNPLRFQIERAGETVNCLNCGMETVLFIPGLKAPYPEDQYRLEAHEIHWARNQFAIRHLAGVVQNTTGKHLNWVRVEFILYSTPNNPVGTTSDCLINMPPTRVWKFSAPVIQPEAVLASEPLLSCEYGRIIPVKPVRGIGREITYQHQVGAP